MYKVRAEIIGEFVIVDTFNTKEQALAKYNSLVDSGIYDDVNIWEV